MLVMALDAYLGWVEQDSAEHAETSEWRQAVARSIDTRLWDGEKYTRSSSPTFMASS
jgi:hypothetical protein